MSEFDRTETYRRSIRRPRKALAPAPPTLTPESNRKAASPLMKRLLIPKPDSASSDDASVKSRVTSNSPISDDDLSHSALYEIQKQIKKIELSTVVQKNRVDFLKGGLNEPSNGKRYDEMESLVDSKGMSNLKISDNNEFVRGEAGRSSIQGVPSKVKQPRPVARTSSDTKQVKMIQKHFKQREDEKKALDQVK